jgi:hypothetical protein
VVERGVVSGLRPPPVPAYTPPPCLPAPEPCGDGDAAVELSTDAGNLSVWDAGGKLLTKLYVLNSEGVTVSGKGVVGDPLRITLDLPDSAVHLVTGSPAAISVTGQGTGDNPFQVAHATQSGGGSLGGFTLDAYGHVVSYEGDNVVGVVSVTALPGTVEHETAGGAVVLSLPSFFDGETDVDTDQGVARFDQYGRLTGFAGASQAHDDFGFLGTVALSDYSYPFSTQRSGKIKGALRGALGLTVAAAGYSPAPPSVSVKVDGLAMAAHLWAPAAGAAQALEFVSNGALAPGDHTLSVAVDSGAPTVCSLDFRLCQ